MFRDRIYEERSTAFNDIRIGATKDDVVRIMEDEPYIKTTIRGYGELWLYKGTPPRNKRERRRIKSKKYELDGKIVSPDDLIPYSLTGFLLVYFGDNIYVLAKQEAGYAEVIDEDGQTGDMLMMQYLEMNFSQ